MLSSIYNMALGYIEIEYRHKIYGFYIIIQYFKII